jgi:segregation and condensation protein A
MISEQEQLEQATALAEALAEAPVDAEGAVKAPAEHSILLYGEPLQKLPTDLYIPPDALEVFLEAFEGPLDLLLYLIRRQNFNILDIPVAQVTQQFLVYVEEIKERNLEMAAEYLLMAAMLIQIKSRMLLPQVKSTQEAGEDDPRAELVRKLLEYEQMKAAALEIGVIPTLGRDVWAADVPLTKNTEVLPPKVSIPDLQRAWSEVVHRAKLTQKHQIGREQLSVREHMTLIMRKLKEARFVEFSEMFDHRGGVAVVVVHFVAMLELAKESMIEITQADAFAPIYVRLAGADI